MRTHNYDYDAFISHAVEDKIPIANELCSRLERAGLKIWYSGKELGIGDSIEKTIQNGLHRSRYGIVIFSPTYLAKNWTIREFYTLLSKEIEEHKVILPVLFNVTLDDLKNKDLLMADRFAVNADRGMDFVVERLVKEIRKSRVVVEKKQFWMARLWFFLFASLFFNMVLLLKDTNLVDMRSPIHVLPARSSVDEVASMTKAGQTSLFDEMVALLRTANNTACACHSSGPSAKSRAFGATSAEGQVTPVSAEDQSGSRAGSHRGRKMTMAVVFQMEMGEERVPAAEREMEALISAASLSTLDHRAAAMPVGFHRTVNCPAGNCHGD